MPLTGGALTAALAFMLVLALVGCTTPAADPPATAYIIYVTATEPADPPLSTETLPAPPSSTPNPALSTATLLAVTPSPTAVPTALPTPPIQLADAPAEVAYTLPLTVQHVTEDAATLFFELETAAEGVLLYWPAGDSTQQNRIDLAAGSARQQITLQGLLPDVEYEALAVLGPDPQSGLFRQVLYSGQIWDPVRFHTVSTQQPLRIGVLGDSGFGEQVTYDLVREMAAYNLDFVIHTGDVVYKVYDNASPYEAFMLKYYQPFAPLLREMPVYPVVGNHDIELATEIEGTPFYYLAFPPFPDPRFAPSDRRGLNKWYAFAYGDIQFLMLDTQTFFGEGGWNAQNEWLTERLADTRFRHTIPVFHVAAYAAGLHPRDGLPVQELWVPQFEAANVPLVLSGHDHNYERFQINGITYVVSGGGSTALYAQSEAPEGLQVFAQCTHFTLLEIYTDRIDVQAIALGGEVLDQATIPLQ